MRIIPIISNNNTFPRIFNKTNIKAVCSFKGVSDSDDADSFGSEWQHYFEHFGEKKSESANSCPVVAEQPQKFEEPIDDTFGQSWRAYMNNFSDNSATHKPVQVDWDYVRQQLEAKTRHLFRIRREFGFLPGEEDFEIARIPLTEAEKTELRRQHSKREEACRRVQQQGGVDCGPHDGNANWG